MPSPVLGGADRIHYPLAQYLRPSPTNDRYGYLWWLNRGSQRFRSAPAKCVYAMGAGSNIIWVDREHDLVAVLRWIAKNAVGDFLAKLMVAIE